MPQITTINQLAAPSSEPDFEEEYVTDEEEVDEIIDDEPPPVQHKLNGKGKAKATPNTLTPSETLAPLEPSKPKPEPELPPLPPRKPGETHVDQQRVEKIIKAHGEHGPCTLHEHCSCTNRGYVTTFQGRCVLDILGCRTCWSC